MCKKNKETMGNSNHHYGVVTPPPPPPLKFNFSLKSNGFLSANGFYLLAGILATFFFTSCQCETTVEPETVDVSPIITNQSFSIMENVPNGTIVGMVDAIGNNRITNYTITDGNTSNAFAISNNGLLTTAGIIDYEAISNYSLTIQVIDESGNTASNTMTVKVIDLDEIAPTITNHVFTIMENVTTSTIVGMVDATDNDRITNYTITAGNTSNAFAISNNGLLTTASTIDYEAISNYSLTVEVTDGSGNTASNTITVNIINISLAPKVATLNPSGIHAVDATLQGNLTDLGEDSDGSIEVSEYGFIYSTNTSNQNTLVLGGSGVEKPTWEAQALSGSLVIQ